MALKPTSVGNKSLFRFKRLKSMNAVNTMFSQMQNIRCIKYRYQVSMLAINIKYRNRSIILVSHSPTMKLFYNKNVFCAKFQQ